MIAERGWFVLYLIFCFFNHLDEEICFWGEIKNFHMLISWKNRTYFTSKTTNQPSLHAYIKYKIFCYCLFVMSCMTYTNKIFKIIMRCFLYIIWIFNFFSWHHICIWSFLTMIKFCLIMITFYYYYCRAWGTRCYNSEAWYWYPVAW